MICWTSCRSQDSCASVGVWRGYITTDFCIMVHVCRLFSQLSVSLCSSHVTISAEDELNQEVTASQKTEMVGSTKRGQCRCRGECQCLKPPTDVRLCRTKRHSSALTTHFQLWEETTEKLEATRSKRCDGGVRAQAEVRERTSGTKDS